MVPIMRGVHRVLVGKPEGKRPLGRPRRRWEDNIKMYLQEVRGGCGDWMELAQDRDRWRALVSTVRNLRVPKMRGISWLAAEPVIFSRRTLLHGVSKYGPRNKNSPAQFLYVRKFLMCRRPERGYDATYSEVLMCQTAHWDPALLFTCGMGGDVASRWPTEMCLNIIIIRLMSRGRF